MYPIVCVGVEEESKNDGNKNGSVDKMEVLPTFLLPTSLLPIFNGTKSLTFFSSLKTTLHDIIKIDTK